MVGDITSNLEVRSVCRLFVCLSNRCRSLFCRCVFMVPRVSLQTFSSASSSLPRRVQHFLFNIAILTLPLYKCRCFVHIKVIQLVICPVGFHVLSHSSMSQQCPAAIPAQLPDFVHGYRLPSSTRLPSNGCWGSPPIRATADCKRQTKHRLIDDTLRLSTVIANGERAAQCGNCWETWMEIPEDRAAGSHSSFTTIPATLTLCRLPVRSEVK